MTGRTGALAVVVVEELGRFAIPSRRLTWYGTGGFLLDEEEDEGGFEEVFEAVFGFVLESIVHSQFFRG